MVFRLKKKEAEETIFLACSEALVMDGEKSITTSDIWYYVSRFWKIMVYSGHQQGIVKPRSLTTSCFFLVYFISGFFNF